jgi:hypothetical protein
MVLILDLRQDMQGRLQGTVCQEKVDTVRAFDGIIELVAVLENCLAEESAGKDETH